MHQTFLAIDWHDEIRKLRADGHTVCPLMAHVPGSSRPPTCRCDIETLRRVFLEENTHCTEGDCCLPRINSPREACNEAATYHRRHPY